MDYEKRKHFIVGFAYTAIILMLFYVVIKYGLGMIAPFLFAFIVASALRRPARFLAKRLRLPEKPVGLLLVLLFYGTVGVLVSLLLVQSISSVVRFIPGVPTLYTTEIEPALRDFFGNLGQLAYRMDPMLVAALDNLFSQFIQSLGSLVTSVSVNALRLASGFAATLPGLFIKIVLMIISTFFIIGDYDLLTGFMMRQFSPRHQELLLRMRAYVVGTLFACVRSYAIIMSITFVELSIGLSLLGVSGAVSIALLIAFFDILPVLGTGGIMIPWICLSAIQGNVGLALGLLCLYLFVSLIRNIIEPKIVGDQMGLHPVVALMSMFVGVRLFGGLGLFGLPILLSLLRHLSDTGMVKIFK